MTIGEASSIAFGEKESEKAPRVLLFGSKFSGGGAETRLRHLAQYLFGGTADAALLMEADKNVVATLPRPVFEFGWSGRASYPGVVVRLRQVIARGRYDAALALGLHQNAVLWAATRGMAKRPAIIMTETTRPNTNDILAGRPLVRNIRAAVHRTIYRDADLVAANSIDGVAEIAGHYGVGQDRITRIPNIIDCEHVLRLTEGPVAELARSDVKSICMVTRLEQMKRVDTLIEAMSGLASQPGWCVEVIGDGPHRGELENLARKLAIADRIHFRGWQRNPYPFMARACATVLCSIYEGFSNTVLESMAIGTPVVTSFCSSDARTMVEAGAALGFEVGDSATLRKHMSRLLSGDAPRAMLIESALKYIAPHRIENAAATYEALVCMAIRVKRIADGRAST